MDRATTGKRLALVAMTVVLGVALVGGAATGALSQPADLGRVAAGVPRIGVVESAHFGGPRPPLGDLIGAALAYIGLAKDEYLAARRAGQTLAEVAVANGKTRDGLIAALTDAANAAIDEAIAGGKLTAERAAGVRATVSTHITALVDSTRGPGFARRPKGIRGAPYLSEAAAYLGIPLEDLPAQLHAGQTLAQIADATAGKSRDGLIDALTAAARSRIADLVDRTVPFGPGR